MWQALVLEGVHDPVPGVPPGTYVETSVPAPPMVANVSALVIAEVESEVKWFTASAVVLWQIRHPAATWKPWLCSPELLLLNCGAPDAWQLVHWVFTSSVPVRQLSGVPGVPPDLACPPWQLTFEQLRVALSNEVAPVSASYVAGNARSPGGTRSAFNPGRALARS